MGIAVFYGVVNSDLIEPGYFLTIQPVHLDVVQVYDENLEIVFDGGDTVPSPRGLMSGGYTVELGEDLAGKHLYIRLSSRNIIQPYISIDPPEHLFRRSLGVVLTSALAVSVSLFYLAWTISASFSKLNPLTLMFGLRLIVFIFTSGIHSGIIRQLSSADLLPPQDLAHNLSALIYITVAQIFDYFLLKETCHKRGCQTFAIIVLFASVSKFFFFISGQVSSSLQINNFSALFTLLLGLVLALLPNSRQKNSQNFSENKLSRFVPFFYFLLQALPLAGLYALTASGSTRYLEYSDLAFLNYAIVPGGFILYILARRQREQLQLQRHLRERADRLQREKQAEAERRRDINNLLNMLTHEIKTPLATLQMAQAIDRVDDDMLLKTTAAIKQAITQVDHVEELEHGQSMVQMASVDICAAVKKAISNSHRKPSYTFCDESVKVLTDPRLLQVILNNLIGNAFKYCQRGSIPSIYVSRLSDSLSVTVANSIDRELHAPDRLTEKYYRDPTSQGSSGTGLGLYIVQVLCDQLGHDLHIETLGSQFSVTITMK